LARRYLKSPPMPRLQVKGGICFYTPDCPARTKAPPLPTAPAQVREAGFVKPRPPKFATSYVSGMSSEEELEKAVLVITSDDALGYTIEKVFGIVNGIGSTAGRTSKNKGTDSYNSALAWLRYNAHEKGGNAVIGLRQSTYAASHGGAFGDAVGVVLSGTAVVLGPRAMA